MRKFLTAKAVMIKKYMDDWDNPKKESVIFAIIMISSLLLRFFYICYTSVYDMQHDVGTPYERDGHLGYIAYLMSTHHLPDFDVREAFQFWHPPVHHAVSALFLSVVWKLIPVWQGNYEALQLLPFVYVTICIWLVWKLLKLWDYNGKSAIFPFFLIAFNPTFIIMSGSVNNDPLCYMFMFLAMYFAVLWYRMPSYHLIMACALSIGFGMSTKGTAAIIAFPVGFLFLMRLIKEKKKVLWQLALFAVLVFPLGLWWYIRNYLLYGVPVNYIYYTGADTIGYLGYMPAWKRMLDFDIHHFSFENIYLQFEGRYTDTNPIIGLLKTTVFGQWRYNYNLYIKALAYVLFFIWVALVVVSLCAVWSFVKKRKEYLAESISIVILFAVQFASYYHFCITYPFVWTMDIRYAVPILLCQCLFAAEYIREKKRFKYGTICLCSLFAIIAVMCFVLLSFTRFA